MAAAERDRRPRKAGAAEGALCPDQRSDRPAEGEAARAPGASARQRGRSGADDHAAVPGHLRTRPWQRGAVARRFPR